MLLQAHAKLPIDTSSVADALRGVAEFVERHLAPGPETELAVSLAQTGTRGNALLARLLPPETRAFHLGLLPVGEGLTAREFREAIPKAKPSHTASQIRVRGPASREAVHVIRALADELPTSARGIILV